jgi:very-short-patch-repair endonuclease
MKNLLTLKQRVTLLARSLRRNQTEAERIFWSKVRNKQFLGYKFLRQHPVFYGYFNKVRYFIVDFYCHELKLVIEIDGGIHKRQRDHDQIRTDILKSQCGLRVIRFSNEEVIDDIDRVLLKLTDPPPAPPPYL